MNNSYIRLTRDERKNFQDYKNKLKWAHIIGALAQLTLWIWISIAIDNSNIDEIIARSTVLTVYQKQNFPKRIRELDIFGHDRSLQPGKSYAALEGSLLALNAPCQTVACCAEYGTINAMPEDVLIKDCYDETDKRWSDPYGAHVHPPGYNVLILVLIAPLISFIHHAWVLLSGNEENIVLKYIDYSLSSSFILMVLYQFVRVYAFETQVLGFFCCALSMWFAYSYEMTFDLFYFILGAITHILAWLPFFINIGQLMSHKSTLDVETKENEVKDETKSESSDNVGIGLAIGGTLAIYTLYPLLTYLYVKTSYLQFIHTALSVFAKTILVVGVLIAIQFI